MSNRISRVRGSATAAFVAPFLAYMLLQPLASIFRIENSALPWYEHSPEHWVYPLQTVVCLILLGFFWRHYPLRPARGVGIAVTLGIAGILIWFTPSWLYGPLGVADWPQPTFEIPLVVAEGTPVWSLLGLAERTEGFDPTLFEGQPLVTVLVIFFRFLRMVVVVALIEEIFWRGFLMRYLADPDRSFTETAFGTHTWKGYWITTLAFTIVHLPEDWLGAFIYGSLAYWLAVRTKSLFACVIMHGVANLLLGLYVMVTREWGFW